MKKVLFYSCFALGLFLLFAFMLMSALRRNVNCDIHRREMLLRNNLLIAMKQEIPHYILTYPDIDDKEFSNFLNSIYHQKEIYILNNLSVWKSHLTDTLANDPIAVWGKSERGFIGYRFSGKLEKNMRDEP